MHPGLLLHHLRSSKYNRSTYPRAPFGVPSRTFIVNYKEGLTIYPSYLPWQHNDRDNDYDVASYSLRIRWILLLHTNHSHPLGRRSCRHPLIQICRHGHCVNVEVDCTFLCLMSPVALQLSFFCSTHHKAYHTARITCDYWFIWRNNDRVFCCIWRESRLPSWTWVLCCSFCFTEVVKYRIWFSVLFHEVWYTCDNWKAIQYSPYHFLFVNCTMKFKKIMKFVNHYAVRNQSWRYWGGKGVKLENLWL